MLKSLFYLKVVLKDDDFSRGVYDLFSKNSKRGYEDKKNCSVEGYENLEFICEKSLM